MAEIAEILNASIRSLLAFFSLLLFMRWTRKKQLSAYTFYDYAVAITIGSIAATLSIELENRTLTVYAGLIVWAVLPIILGWLYLKSISFRKVMDSEPVVIIKDGKLMEDNIKKELLNLEDLQMQLRSGGIFDISEVEYAVLEKNGQVNALKKKENQPVTLLDLELPVTNKGTPLILIMDGKLMKDTIKQSPYSEAWLKGELNKKGINSISQVVLAQVDTAGSLYVDSRDDHAENPINLMQERIRANLNKALLGLEELGTMAQGTDMQNYYWTQLDMLKSAGFKYRNLINQVPY